MKKIGLFFVCALLTVATYAQKAEISFEKTTHDYGQVNEEDGKVKCTFEFTNTGDAPLVLNSVTASCGCTSPSWTREPVAPGTKGKIDVEYSTSGRVGPINKSITVKSNATTPTVLLHITGEVLPRGQAKPFEINAGGDLRLKSDAADFGKVEKGNSISRTLDIQNTGKGTVKIAVENLPAYLTASAAPVQLKADEKGKITLTFNSASYQHWGQFTEKASITINGVKVPVTVSGIVLDNFAKLTKEQKQNAPIAEITPATYSFGQLKSGAKKSLKLKIANRGVDALEIRNIDNKNAELTIGKVKTVTGGKDTQLAVELSAKGLSEGSYKSLITLQTNDPNNPLAVVTLDWTVVK